VSSRVSQTPRAATAFATLGVCAALVAVALDASDARAAAAQDWPPFVLVAGLLLVGLVADDDGLFDSVGTRLSRVVPGQIALYCAVCLLISAVTAILNLDTSVAFLTPLLVYLARARRSDEALLVYACLFLSNAASLLLPGSNLTNLIVLGHLHLSGGRFAAHMALPFVASVVTTALLLGLIHRRHLFRPRSVEATSGTADTSRDSDTNTGTGPQGDEEPLRSRSWALSDSHRRIVGVVATVSVTVVVLALRSPALWVAGVGIAAVGIRLFQRRVQIRHVVEVVSPQILLGLLAVAIALGTAGRAWDGPAVALAHLDSWATAAFAAVTSVVTNNLPAASLLAARVPPHPFSLLVGLNLGPNLFVTGSLSSLIWLRGARAAGSNPSISRVARLGAVVVPVSLIASVGALIASGSH
jgi:arsenical pump membrane protein